MIKRVWTANAIVGIALGGAMAWAGYVAIQYWKAFEPATNWLHIDMISIRDANPGEDPRIAYKREILRDFPATYIATVFRFEDKADTTGTFYCSGNGGSTYKKGRKLPPAALTLSWLMNREARPCILERGIYRVTITYTITPDGYSNKVLTVDSNYFVVPPEDKAQ